MFVSVSESRCPEAGKQRVLMTDTQEVFQMHFKIIPNARPSHGADYGLATWGR
jgi:hypothetical protein